MNIHEFCGGHSGLSRVDKRLCASECRREFPHIAIGRATCTPIAPIIAPSSALPTSARPSAFRAGSTASATTATCCSSTCATITGSPRSLPIRIRRRSRRSTGSGVESVVTVDGDVVAAVQGGGEPESADRRDRGPRPRGHGSVRRRRAADAGGRRAGLSGGDPAQVPLPRSSPRAGARQHHAALGGDRLDPPPDDRPGLHRVPDADPDRQLARGRARLSRPEPRPSGQVLRASAGAADVQAADHGRGLRPLFPDRALLPRRGRPRRPQPGRILPARLRDELRHAGRRVQRDRAGAVGRVRGVRRRQDRHSGGRISAHPVQRGDAEVRQRQAGPAQSAADHRRRRSTSRAPASACSPGSSRRARSSARSRRPARPRRAASSSTT